jgi:hypothetical protein
MFTPSSSGLVGTSYNQHAATGHARHQGRRQPSVARKRCRSFVPAAQNAGIFNFRSRHGHNFPLAPLASAPLPFQKRAPLEQHLIGAPSHGWRICGSFLCLDVSIPDVSIPDISKSAAISMRPFGAAGAGRARQTRSLTNSTRASERHRPRIFISIFPVTRFAPSLDERMRVTSSIGGVHSLEARLQAAA